MNEGHSLRAKGSSFHLRSGFRLLSKSRELAQAAFPPAKRSRSMETMTRKPRRVETPEERKQRLMTEADFKRNEAAADEAAVDRMIRRNIEQYGP